jgi:2-phospho-L-lactate transferase CofD
LFSRVARIPEGSLVLPAICTEERITLAAELADGSVLVGQNEISHPAMCASPLAVDKTQKWEAFQSPVRRIFYLSAEGDRQEHEVAPSPNPRLISEIRSADAVIYGMGSLYTSVCPSLVLRGVGEAVASRKCPKILILNGGTDRETSSCQAHPGPMTASDVVLAITDALNRRGASSKSGRLGNQSSQYVSAVIVPRGGRIVVDDSALVELGINTVVQVAAVETADGSALYDPDALVDAIGNIVLGEIETLTAATPKLGSGKIL